MPLNGVRTRVDQTLSKRLVLPPRVFSEPFTFEDDTRIHGQPLYGMAWEIHAIEVQSLISTPLFVPTISTAAAVEMVFSGAALTRRLDIRPRIIHKGHRVYFQVKWEGEPNHEIPIYVGIHGHFIVEICF